MSIEFDVVPYGAAKRARGVPKWAGGMGAASELRHWGFRCILCNAKDAVQTMWCNVCDTTYVMQSMLCSLCGGRMRCNLYSAVYAVQSMWYNVCDATCNATYAVQSM